MCGRYSSTRDPGDLAAEFEAEWAAETEVPASYNVAPTDPVYVVRARHREPGRVLQVARWGLVPPWADDVKLGARMINARAETILTSGAFKRAAAARRCLVPADGWYEWAMREHAPNKQAFYLSLPGAAGVAFAGLYDFWRPKGSAEHVDWLLTCTVITTEAVGALADIHDRMPLALPRQRWADWLDPGRADPGALLEPDTALFDSLELRAVDPAVGNVANNGARLQERDDTAADPRTLF